MKNKIILLLLITFLSCSKTEEEVCNCRENNYKRNWENSNSFTDRLINQRDIDGCYTLEEAKEKVWYTSENYTIVQCDDYL